MGFGHLFSSSTKRKSDLTSVKGFFSISHIQAQHNSRNTRCLCTHLLQCDTHSLAGCNAAISTNPNFWIKTKDAPSSVPRPPRRVGRQRRWPLVRLPKPTHSLFCAHQCLQFPSAGSRDSPLTSHGVLQARRLGSHLAAGGIDPIHHVFASNLQRAAKTAAAIADAQSTGDGAEDEVQTVHVVQCPELREKDFGSEEGTRYVKRDTQTPAQQTVASSAASYIPPESQEAMRVRIERFVVETFLPAVLDATSHTEPAGSIVVVAHGIILNVLLRCLLTRWGPDEFARLPGAAGAPLNREWLASWSNTGYLEAEVRVPAGSARPATVERAIAEASHDSVLSRIGSTTDQASTDAICASLPPDPTHVDVQIFVNRVNCVDHLQGLKKTRGGIGSAGFDAKQKTMESFFSPAAKRPRQDDDGSA